MFPSFGTNDSLSLQITTCDRELKLKRLRLCERALLTTSTSACLLFRHILKMVCFSQFYALMFLLNIWSSTHFCLFCWSTTKRLIIWSWRGKKQLDWIWDLLERPTAQPRLLCIKMCDHVAAPWMAPPSGWSIHCFPGEENPQGKILEGNTNWIWELKLYCSITSLNSVFKSVGLQVLLLCKQTAGKSFLYIHVGLYYSRCLGIHK